jgi:hypothetical protein
VARLNVDVAARWASGGGFAITPILVAVSVSDEAGVGIRGLSASAFRVRYQIDPDNSFLGAASDFHEHGSALSGAGEYSLIVKPTDEINPQIWVQDQVFLYVTVRAAGNHGQALYLATFHQPL